MADIQNKVALTSTLIQSQPNAKALLELEPVRQNWGEVYAKTTGRTIQDGLTRFEAEKILFLQQASNNKQLAECDKFSIYAAFTELAISGGSLRDGLCYIVPFKQKAVFMPGWKFRLEQINELPNVVHCHEPKVVYDCDHFDYELGMKTRIISHKPGNRTADNKITFVYWVIEFKHGPEVYIMDALKVYQIRDQYSKSYQEYVKAAKAANVAPDGRTPIMKDGKYGQYEVELPMWVKDESQAFQKTIVRQTWKHLPKTPKMKWLEDRAKVSGIEEMDPEEDTLSEQELDKLILHEDNPAANVNPANTTDAGEGAVKMNDAPAGHWKPAAEEIPFVDVATGEMKEPATAEVNPDVPF